MKNHEDLGIYSEEPFIEKVIKTLDRVTWILFRHPTSAMIWSSIWMILLVLIVSSRLSFHSGSMLFSVIVILVLILCGYAWITMAMKIFVPGLNEFIVGKPVFGKLKAGLPRKTFFTMIKCASAIKYEFKPEDAEVVKEYNKIDVEITEEALKLAYRENAYKVPTSPQPDDFDSRWSKIWNQQILLVGTEGTTFRDALSEDNISFRTILLKLPHTANLVIPFLEIFQLIMIFFIASYLNGGVSLLTVLQIGIFLSFLISIIWYVHHSYNITEITFIGAVDTLPAEIKIKFFPRLRPFVGKKVRATKITVEKRYLSLVRGYLARACLSELILTTSAGLIMVGIALLVGLIWPGVSIHDALIWYRNFAIGIVLIPIGLFIGYYLIFLLLQNTGPVLAPVVAGFLSALLPFLTGYLFTGKFELGEAKSALTATIAGVGTLLAGAMTSVVRDRLEEKK